MKTIGLATVLVYHIIHHLHDQLCLDLYASLFPQLGLILVLASNYSNSENLKYPA